MCCTPSLRAAKLVRSEQLCHLPCSVNLMRTCIPRSERNHVNEKYLKMSELQTRIMSMLPCVFLLFKELCLGDIRRIVSPLSFWGFQFVKICPMQPALSSMVQRLFRIKFNEKCDSTLFVYILCSRSTLTPLIFLVILTHAFSILPRPVISVD